MKQIPVAHPWIAEEEKRAVLAVLESGQVAQGPMVAELERRFAEWCGVKHAVAVTSGTTGLHVALLAHGISEGDEVITTPFTFIASANAPLFVGARPVFVDIEPTTFCLDPNLVEAAITARTKAILPVHLYGHPAPMDALREIAHRRGLLLIEDACQAHGAAIAGRKVGGLGDSAVFSLYPTKNMTSGEGGFITTNDDDVAYRSRLLRSHGQVERYRHTILGYNFRLSDLHAAIGLEQLIKLDRFNAARRANATRLSQGLTGIEGVTVPTEIPGSTHVYHQYTIRVEHNRQAWQRQLTALGVGTAVHYPIPVHKQPLYQDLGYGGVKMPVAERMAEEVLSLPVHPRLSGSDLDQIIEAVREVSAHEAGKKV